MRRLWSWFAVLGLLAAIGIRATPSSVAQSAATPVASPPQLFTTNGVSAPIFAMGQVDSLTNPDRMRLEQLDIRPGRTTLPHTTAGPELIASEEGGIATITDTFGFSTTIKTGTGILIRAGSTYQISNRDLMGSMTLLRFSVAAGHDTPLAASPVAASPAATPVAPSVRISHAPAVTLLDQPFTGFPSGPVQLFLAVGTWQPGATSGRLEHAGPLGIVNPFRTPLSVTSPSGIKGQLMEGKGVLLPAGVPLEASNDTKDPASAIMVGVAPASGPLVNLVTPTPTPSPIPTETPVPTQTPTPAPTATQAPSPTPQPTADLNTQAGTLLANHGTWRNGNALLTMDVTAGQGRGGFVVGGIPSDCYLYESAGDIAVELTYVNASTQRQDFVAAPGLVKVSSNDGAVWESHCVGSSTNSNRIVLEPGESATYRIGFTPPQGMNTVATVTVEVPSLGEISGARWQFDYVQGKIEQSSNNSTSPSSTVVPTATETSLSPNGAQARRNMTARMRQ